MHVVSFVEGSWDICPGVEIAESHINLHSVTGPESAYFPHTLPTLGVTQLPNLCQSVT
jgi:hypothetical protein